MKIRLAFLVIFISVFFPYVAVADNPAIQNIRISNSYTHLNLRFQLTNSFTLEMKEAIGNGIPTVFTYRVKLLQQRSFWGDKFLMETTFSKTIKLDNLKNEYTIVASNKNNGNGDIGSVVSTFSEAKRLIEKVQILSIYPIWKLERNNTYYFEIKAEAEGVKPPPYVHYLLFFLDWKYFETDWVIEKFRY